MVKPMKKGLPRQVASVITAGTLVISMCPAPALADAPSADQAALQSTAENASELNAAAVQGESSSEQSGASVLDAAAQPGPGEAGYVALTVNCGGSSGNDANMTMKVVLNDDLQTYTAYIEGTGAGNFLVQTKANKYYKQITRTVIGEGVTTLGQQPFSSCSALKEVSFPSTLTSVPYRCFTGCPELETVTIPENSQLTTIEGDAFSQTKLKSIYIPETVKTIGSYALRETALTSVELPSQLTSVGDSAFYGCTSLASVSQRTAQSMPEKCTYGRSFMYCSALTSVNLPDNAVLGDSTFYGCTSLESFAIPKATTQIACFGGCTSLKTVTFHDGVTSIGTSAFRNCTSLESLNLPAGITSIGDTAFYGAAKLSTLNLPAGVTSIGKQTFYGCTSLGSLNLPAGVASIGQQAFRGCTALKAMVFPSALASIGANAFQAAGTISLDFTNVADKDALTIGLGAFTTLVCGEGEQVSVTGLTADQLAKYGSTRFPASVIPYDENGFSIANGVLYGVDASKTSAEVTIPSTVTAIGDQAFYNNTTITKVVIPDTVTAIGEQAFSGCSSLEEVATTQNCSVSSLGNRAFYNCKALQSISLPHAIASMGEYCFNGCSALANATLNVQANVLPRRSFYGCNKLVSVDFNGSTFTEVGDSAFSDCYQLTGFANFDFSTVKKVDSSAFEAAGKGDTSSYSFPSACLLDLDTSGVTSYGMSAFAFSGLKKAVVSADCTIMDTYTFRQSGISSLDYRSVSAPISRNMAYGCANLASVSLADGVTISGSSSFYNCTSLRYVYLPASVTALPAYAFQGCTGLEMVSGLQNVTSFDSSVFDGCTSLRMEALRFSPSLTTIGYSCFNNCASLKGMVDFSGCSELTTIDSSAFAGASGITGVDFTGCTSLTRIGSRAFADGDFDVAGITGEVGRAFVADTNANAFPSRVYNGTDAADENGLVIAGDVLVNASAVEGAVTIPDTVKIINKNAFTHNANVTSVVIPEGVTSIPDGEFNGCTALESVTLPSTLTAIGQQAFYGCNALKGIAFPESLTTIGNSAFANAFDVDAPADLYIPGSVSSVSQNSFSGAALKNIRLGDGIASMGWNVFYNTSAESIFIPSTVKSLDSGSLNFSTPVRFTFANATALNANARACYTDAVEGDSVVIHGAYTDDEVSKLKAIARFANLDFTYEDCSRTNAVSDVAPGTTRVNVACDVCGTDEAFDVNVASVEQGSEQAAQLAKAAGSNTLLGGYDVSVFQAADEPGTDADAQDDGEGAGEPAAPVAVTSGFGTLRVSIEVGAAYNGSSFYVVTPETDAAATPQLLTVEDGKATFQVSAPGAYGVVYNTSQVSSNSLADAISAAQEAYGTVTSSADGSDVTTDALWAAPDAVSAYADAIAAAQAVLSNTKATQPQVNDAKAALDQASAAFTDAVKAGRSIANANVTVGSVTFTGSAVAPGVTVTLPSGEELSDADFDVAYFADADCTRPVAAADLKDAGSYYAQVSGAGSYTGTAHVVAFAVSAASGNVVTAQGSAAVYDGQPHGLAAASASAAGSTLYFSTDNGATWSDESPEFTDAGSYVVLVKAVNPNYVESDPVSTTVTIERAGASLSAAPGAVTVNAGTSAFAAVAYVGDGTIAVSSSDPSVAVATYADGIVKIETLKAGSATITVSAAGAKNYADAEDVVIDVTAQAVAPSLSLAADDASIEIGSSAEVGISYDGDGELSAVSSNPKVATASIVNGMLVIESVSKGTATVTVSAAAGAVSSAAQASLNVAVCGKSYRFPDVSDPSAWYYDSVYEAVDLGLFGGYDDGTFGPADQLTRAQAAMVLWRHFDPEAAGSYVAGDAVNATGMPDVESGTWYTGAANWAVANGIINGYDGEDGRTFGPNDTVTREQMCVIVANAAGMEAGYDTASLDAMPDADQVSGWAREAVAWCLDHKVISGVNVDGVRYVEPGLAVDRATMATLSVNAVRAGVL